MIINLDSFLGFGELHCKELMTYRDLSMVIQSFMQLTKTNNHKETLELQQMRDASRGLQIQSPSKRMFLFLVLATSNWLQVLS